MFTDWGLIDCPNLVSDCGLIDRPNLVTDWGLIDPWNFVTDWALRDGINLLTGWRLNKFANVFSDFEAIFSSSLFHWLLYLFSDTWSPFRLNKLLRSIWFEIPSFASNNRNRRKCVLVVTEGFDSTSPKVHRKANSLHRNTTWMCQNIFITKMTNLRSEIYCAVSNSVLALNFFIWLNSDDLRSVLLFFGWTTINFQLLARAHFRIISELISYYYTSIYLTLPIMVRWQ